MSYDSSTSPEAPGSRQLTPSASKVDTTFKAEDILLEEFRHAGSAAIQAKEERANLLSLYLLAAGVLATGLGIIGNLLMDTAHESIVALTLVEAAVLVASFILSFAFFVRLLELGREYRDSLLTMNVIKEFYIQHLERDLPEIDRAFRVRLANTPKIGRFGGVTLLMIALLGSLALGASGWEVYGLVLFLAHSNGTILTAFGLEGLLFVTAVLIHTIYYRFAVRSRIEAASLGHPTR